ncbi:hydrolase [Sphingomonas baiyangensis]|uniref:Hydrolase n=1 Tax=Sphingomonas baiyangensis TaxID=2572576 RepID=A0A4U1L7C4_9SPHN|nr:hydrolase [Sphingomonas baiyangensis]TKD52857.1 hydrolase [Sphingomonas baiyangensis]
MQGLNSTERAAVDHVAAAPIADHVAAWVAVNSGTRNLKGVARMGEMLADAFSALPGGAVLVAPEPVEQVDGEGRVQRLDHGRHLLVTVRPQAPVQMLFTGHMDTVFPVDHRFQKLTVLPDGRWNGPGAADMKGGLAVLLAALKAIEAGPAAARLGYQVLINSDEETGSLASADRIAQTARGKVAALTYEPALADGTLAGARGGTGNFALVVSGRSAHAGRNPEEGRNAVVAAADLALRLARAGRAGLAVNPARIEGGGPNNVVPDHAILRVNFRPSDAAAIADAQAALDEAVAAVAPAHDVRIAVHGGFNRPPKPIDPASQKLFGLVKAAGADLGIPVAWRSTGGVCDGNNIAAAGVPVVDTMGVRGGAIHSADEFMIPESLAERAALSAVTILRIAERGRP